MTDCYAICANIDGDSAFTMLQFGCGGVYEQVIFTEFLFTSFTLNFMLGFVYWMNKVEGFFFCIYMK